MADWRYHDIERVYSESGDAHYQQQWQGQLAHEARALQALKGRRQGEKEQLYLYEINIGELTQLAEAGLQIVLAKTYPVANVREAYGEARRGKLLRKSVIVLD